VPQAKKPKTEPSCRSAGHQPYRCLVCTKLFRKRDSFDQHVRLHTDDEEAGTSPTDRRPKSHSFRCEVCSKTFTWYYHLKRHMTVHTGEKPFPCSECSKSFYEKDSLAHHFDVAHGKKSYQCPECAKMFPHLALFKTHVTVHVDRIMDRQVYGRTDTKDF
jgi:KRAB domain-containing zinc finger protein